MHQNVTTRDKQAADKSAIRPFTVSVPEAELTELRRRVNATKWPERETVTDATQGVQLATMQALARYWGTEYDWRKVEARLSALPQFITEIDGLDIHFIHVRSKHENALPLIVTHGWPGSIIEQMKIIDPLTNPTAHGGNASDAFHLVIPSMPGYGYSGKPTTLAIQPRQVVARCELTPANREITLEGKQPGSRASSYDLFEVGLIGCARSPLILPADAPVHAPASVAGAVLSEQICEGGPELGSQGFDSQFHATRSILP
jgi:pimeloyl-ACP methyl ester carboxylesterase